MVIQLELLTLESPIALLNQGNCSVSPSVRLSSSMFWFCCDMGHLQDKFVASLSMKILQSTVTQLRKEENDLIVFGQLVDKGVFRVSKALILIMENRTVFLQEFAHILCKLYLSSHQYLTVTISVLLIKERLCTVYLVLSVSCLCCIGLSLSLYKGCVCLELVEIAQNRFRNKLMISSL